MNGEDLGDRLNGGFIKLYRRFTNWAYYKDPVCKPLFIHLLIMAASKPTKVHFNGVTIDLSRGELATSLHCLEIALNLSKQQIRNGISKLSKTCEITTRSVAHRGMVISICNYNVYHPPKDNCEHADDHGPNTVPTRSQHGPNTHNKKERSKEGEEVKKKTNTRVEYTSEFEKFWKAYPRREGKGAAFKSFKAALKRHKDLTPDQLHSAAVAYSKEVASKEQRYIPHPQRWLNEDRWCDEPVNGSQQQIPIDPEAAREAAREAKIKKLMQW